MTGTAYAPACPNCAVALDRAYKRKSVCKSCGLTFVIRSAGVALFGRRELTESEARVLDAFQYLEQLGVTPAEYRDTLQDRPAGPRRAADALWTLWQLALGTRPELAPFHYLQMALFVNAEGRDPTYLLILRHKSELQRMQRVGGGRLQVTAKVVASLNACEACKALEGAEFPVEQALSEMPLPHKGCSWIPAGGTHPLCRCAYRFDIQ